MGSETSKKRRGIWRDKMGQRAQVTRKREPGYMVVTRLGESRSQTLKTLLS
jgi:hypothetical protein